MSLVAHIVKIMASIFRRWIEKKIEMYLKITLVLEEENELGVHLEW
jgi:hypothetical protein